MFSLLAYQILSTGLFTSADIYSQPGKRKNLNTGGTFLHLPAPAAPGNPARPQSLVNKFSRASRGKAAAPEKFSLDTKAAPGAPAPIPRPCSQAGGAAGAAAAGFFLPAAFLRLT